MKKTTLFFAFINLAISSFSQNVGIGLTTPSAKLQINSTSTASRPLLLLSDSSGGIANTIEFTKEGISNKWSLSSSLQSAANSSSLRFGFTGGVTPFTLLGDGKVGINNNNPATALHVNSSLASTAIFNAPSAMFITLAEQGIYRGYIGSYAGNAEDVDFGTTSNNATGKVHLTTGIIPRLTITPNGNIGIGTQTPTEKFDVHGNINVSETIKANGVAGQPGQVLSLNNNGNIAWVDLSEFKNHRTFVYQAGTITWTVPASVTRIMVEGWGGGGGGSNIGGGGGGGYVSVWFIVTAGDIVSFQIGNRGAGGDNTNGGTNGGATTINTSTESVRALGGIAAGFLNGSGEIGRGGSYERTTNSIGYPGEDGHANRFDYHQSNATTFLESFIGGKGGDAGNGLHTGSKGGYRLYNLSTATQIRQAYPIEPHIPGGGGAGHHLANPLMCAGAPGMVIIHY